MQVSIGGLYSASGQPELNWVLDPADICAAGAAQTMQAAGGDAAPPLHAPR